MFSLWTAILAITHIDDSSQLRLVPRCRFSIVGYYQPSQPLPSRGPVERGATRSVTHFAETITHVSLPAFSLLGFRYSISKAILALLNRVIEYL